MRGSPVQKDIRKDVEIVPAAAAVLGFPVSARNGVFTAKPDLRIPFGRKGLGKVCVEGIYLLGICEVVACREVTDLLLRGRRIPFVGGVAVVGYRNRSLRTGLNTPGVVPEVLREIYFQSLDVGAAESGVVQTVADERIRKSGSNVGIAIGLGLGGKGRVEITLKVRDIAAGVVVVRVDRNFLRDSLVEGVSVIDVG